MSILKADKVTKDFGGLRALHDINVDVEKGDILAIIGPNGAGKTTFFNIISGIYPPTSGKIIFKNRDISGLRPHKICRMGISRTYQLVRTFNDITVLENVLIGKLYGKDYTDDLVVAKKDALSIVEFVGLAEKAESVVKSLTLADRRKLEIGRAIANSPEVMLLDEVVAGLTPTETLKAMELIQKISKELGITILLVEHVIKAVMGLSNRVVVLDYGEKICEGKPEEIVKDSKVIKAYLGTD